MNPKKKKRLLANGWTCGDTTEFLQLTKEDAELIELKIALSQLLQKRRQQKHLSQTRLAELISSPTSRKNGMASSASESIPSNIFW